MSKKNKMSFIGRDLTNHNIENSVTNGLSEELSENFKTLLTTENSQRDIITDANAIVGSSSLTTPSDVLDILVEATYNIKEND